MEIKDIDTVKYYNITADSYLMLYKLEQLDKFSYFEHYLIEKGKLLDVGAGPGFFIFPKELDVYAIDPSMNLLQYNPAFHKKVAYAEKIPYEDNMFDQVISVTACHHFKEEAFDEIKRVGKGNYIITVLKRDPNRQKFVDIIKRKFRVIKKIDHDKDEIFVLGD